MLCTDLFIAEWSVPSLERLRSLVATLAVPIDARYAESAGWPLAMTQEDSVGPPDDRSFLRRFRAADDGLAIELETQDWQGASTASASLPGLEVHAEITDDGARISLQIDERFASAVLARAPKR